jgi:hypothetical protein
MGMAYRDITPTGNVPLLGYGDRTHDSEGVHDPLFVYAWYAMDTDNQQFVWLVFDLCLMSTATVSLLRERIAGKTGYASKNIIIQTTHTHSGPDVAFLHSDERAWAREYTTQLVDRASEALHEALTKEFTGTISVRFGTSRVGVNRRNTELPVDPQVTLLMLEDEQNTVRGVLLHYSCHLTALGVDNYQVSADWIGPVRKYVYEQYGVPVCFLQGAEGNVDPYTRGELIMSDPDQALGVYFEEMEQISQRMIGDVQGAMNGESIFTVSGLRVSHHFLDLPLRFGALTEREVEGKIDTWKERFSAFLEVSKETIPEDGSINSMIKEHCRKHGISGEETERWVASQFTYVEFLFIYKYGGVKIDKRKGTVQIPYTLIDFGRLLFAGMPAEVLVENRFDLQDRFRNKTALICGLVHGSFGYLPHSSNFRESNADVKYETISTIFSETASDILLQDIENHV